MPTQAAESTAKPTLHPDFIPNMVRTFNDSDEHGVHLLFNEWWQHAPDPTIEAYLAHLHGLPGAKAFLAERYFAPQFTLDELKIKPAGSVGQAYYQFLSGNGLETNLATNYKLLHDHLASSGQLDRMPEELRYSIIRGFQVHDILHVITGYTPSGLHELALQAFSLAQWQFPYFGMWMATSTARMTFLHPDGIVPVMDAITQGWQHGRQVKNLSLEKWEEMFDEPLSEVRPEYGIPPAGLIKG